MRLPEHRYRTTSSIAGQLLYVENVSAARMGEEVKVVGPDGVTFEGEVLEIHQGRVLIQLFGETRGLSCDSTEVVFTDAVF